MDCKNCDAVVEVKERLASVDAKLEVYNQLLEHHIKRTDELQDFVSNQQSSNMAILDKVIAQSDKNQAALNRQLKITIGIFTAIAALITALAAWMGSAA
jgi:hypothetical protein